MADVFQRTIGHDERAEDELALDEELIDFEEHTVRFGVDLLAG